MGYEEVKGGVKGLSISSVWLANNRLPVLTSTLVFLVSWYIYLCERVNLSVSVSNNLEKSSTRLPLSAYRQNSRLYLPSHHHAAPLPQRMLSPCGFSGEIEGKEGGLACAVVSLVASRLARSEELERLSRGRGEGVTCEPELTLAGPERMKRR